MATQAEMDRILGKALFDETFRDFLLADPDSAAFSLDYKLTEDQSAHIRRLDPKKMQYLAQQFAEDADYRPSPNFTFW